MFSVLTLGIGVYFLILTTNHITKQIISKSGSSPIKAMDFPLVTDIETWLNDVKGIDEINEEI